MVLIAVVLLCFSQWELIYEDFPVNSWGRDTQACFTNDYSHCFDSSHQQVNGGCKTSIPLIRRSNVVSRNLPIAQMVVVQSLSRVLLFCDPMNCSPPGSLSMEFQARIWSGLPFPIPGDLSDPGIEPGSLTSPALADAVMSPPLSHLKARFTTYDLIISLTTSFT